MSLVPFEDFKAAKELAGEVRVELGRRGKFKRFGFHSITSSEGLTSRLLHCPPEKLLRNENVRNFVRRACFLG